MKRQTKPMSLQRQLMSAVSMMLAAAVALGSSTYAWFVNKSRAEVKDVLFQASAGKNLQISGAVVEADTHTNNATKLGLSQGSQVTVSKAKDLLTYWSSVTPADLGENSFTYPKYPANTTGGETQQYMTPVSIDAADLKLNHAETTFFKAAQWDSSATSGASQVGAYYTYDKVTSNVPAQYICAQLYFKSSDDMDIYLNKSEWTAYTAGNDNSSSGITTPFITAYAPASASDDQKTAYRTQADELAKALRIGFVIGNDTDGAYESSFAAAFRPKTDTFDSATYNTSKSTTGAGGAVVENDKPIKSISDTGNYVATFGDEVTDTIDKYAITGPTGAPTTMSGANMEMTNKSPLFSVKKDVPKRVTIYIWLEGVDKECVSALSSYIGGIYLPFVGVYNKGTEESPDYEAYGREDVEILDVIEPTNEQAAAESEAQAENTAAVEETGEVIE